MEDKSDLSPEPVWYSEVLFLRHTDKSPTPGILETSVSDVLYSRHEEMAANECEEQVDWHSVIDPDDPTIVEAAVLYRKDGHGPVITIMPPTED